MGLVESLKGKVAKLKELVVPAEGSRKAIVQEVKLRNAVYGAAGLTCLAALTGPSAARAVAGDSGLAQNFDPAALAERADRVLPQYGIDKLPGNEPSSIRRAAIAAVTETPTVQFFDVPQPYLSSARSVLDLTPAQQEQLFGTIYAWGMQWRAHTNAMTATGNRFEPFPPQVTCYLTSAYSFFFHGGTGRLFQDSGEGPQQTAAAEYLLYSGLWKKKHYPGTGIAEIDNRARDSNLHDGGVYVGVQAPDGTWLAPFKGVSSVIAEWMQSGLIAGEYGPNSVGSEDPGSGDHRIAFNPAIEKVSLGVAVTNSSASSELFAMLQYKGFEGYAYPTRGLAEKIWPDPNFRVTTSPVTRQLPDRLQNLSIEELYRQPDAPLLSAMFAVKGGEVTSDLSVIPNVGIRTLINGKSGAVISWAYPDENGKIITGSRVQSLTRWRPLKNPDPLIFERNRENDLTIFRGQHFWFPDEVLEALRKRGGVIRLDFDILGQKSSSWVKFVPSNPYRLQLVSEPIPPSSFRNISVSLGSRGQIAGSQFLLPLVPPGKYSIMQHSNDLTAMPLAELEANKTSSFRVGVQVLDAGDLNLYSVEQQAPLSFWEHCWRPPYTIVNKPVRWK